MGESPSRLAVRGGPPVRETMLPYGRQSVDEADIQAVIEVLRSDWLTTGPAVEAFEQALAQEVGARYAVTFSSGTAALHGAAHAADLGPGDEAITTPITFCATANCILYQGARPVFADVVSGTLTLDPDAVERALTPRTRAILPMDYTGHPADLDPLLEIAGGRGLTVIEDACHALGARYRGRRVGSVSHMSVFSFHPVKHVTTAEGGAVTTDDETLARRLRRFRNHGIDSDFRERQSRGAWSYGMVTLGYNYRLTDLQCALGRSQLGKLAGWLSRRREIAARYRAAFAGSAVRPLEVRTDVDPAYHLFVVRLERDRLTVDRDGFFEALRAEGIGANVHYLPVHLHPYYREQLGTGPGLCPIAEHASEEILSLPIFPAMTERDVGDVIAAVLKVAGGFESGRPPRDA